MSLSVPVPRRWRLAALAIGLPALGILATLFIPLIAFLVSSGGARLGPLLNDPYVWRLVLFTYGQAAVCTFVAGMLGVAGAIWLWPRQGSAAVWYERASLSTVALPPIVFAFALFATYGRSGWVGGLLGIERPFFGWVPLLVAHVAFNAPLFLRFVGQALRRLDVRPEAAALSLGARPGRVLWSITLPRLVPEIRSAAVLCFLFCATSFVLPLLLGGGPRFATVEVAIYEAAYWLQDEARAGGLALVHCLIVVMGLLLLPRRASVETSGGSSYVAIRGSSSVVRAAGAVFATAMIFLLALPAVGLLLPGAQGLFGADADSIWYAAVESWRRALACAVLAVPLATAAAYGATRSGQRWLTGAVRGTVALPLAASPVLLAVAMGWFLRRSGVELSSSLWPVACVQALAVQPLVYPPIENALRRVGVDALRAASSFGVAPLRRLWLVELPWIAPALRTATLFAFAFSFGEVGALLLFDEGGEPTLPLLLYRWMGQYRFADADAAALCLAVQSLALFLWGDREAQWR